MPGKAIPAYLREIEKHLAGGQHRMTARRAKAGPKDRLRKEMPR